MRFSCKPQHTQSQRRITQDLVGDATRLSLSRIYDFHGNMFWGGSAHVA